MTPGMAISLFGGMSSANLMSLGNPSLPVDTSLCSSVTQSLPSLPPLYMALSAFRMPQVFYRV